jgi:hypothetical protein
MREENVDIFSRGHASEQDDLGLRPGRRESLEVAKKGPPVTSFVGIDGDGGVAAQVVQGLKAQLRRPDRVAGPLQEDVTGPAQVLPDVGVQQPQPVVQAGQMELLRDPSGEVVRSRLDEKTLTDKEIDGMMGRIMKTAEEELKAEIRK